MRRRVPMTVSLAFTAAQFLSLSLGSNGFVYSVDVPMLVCRISFVIKSVSRCLANEKCLGNEMCNPFSPFGAAAKAWIYIYSILPLFPT